MHCYCEISKKLSRRAVLTKSVLTVNTTKLDEITDLAHQLGFRFFKITVLRWCSKSADIVMIIKSSESLLVTDDSEQLKKERYEILHTQSHEQDCKFLYITHLPDNENEQSEEITSFFWLRFMYLKFYNISELWDVVETTSYLLQSPTIVTQVLLALTQQLDQLYS